MALPVVKISIGVILQRSSVLLTQRDEQAHCGGQWEFPGGKVEANETIQQGLCRELQEELAIGVRAQEPLIQLRHNYGDRIIHCYVWTVCRYSGKPRPQEGQQMRWLAIDELSQLVMPAANQSIVALLLQSSHSAAEELTEGQLI